MVYSASMTVGPDIPDTPEARLARMRAEFQDARQRRQSRPVHVPVPPEGASRPEPPETPTLDDSPAQLAAVRPIP